MDCIFIDVITGNNYALLEPTEVETGIMMNGTFIRLRFLKRILMYYSLQLLISHKFLIKKR